MYYAPTYESELPTPVEFDDDFDLFDPSEPRGQEPPGLRLEALEDSNESSHYILRSLRIICEDIRSANNFLWMCQEAHLACSIRNHVLRVVHRGIFEPAVMQGYSDWISRLPWVTAFQLDALVRDSVLNAQELLRLQLPRMRKEAVSQMREQASMLVKRVALQIAGPKKENGEESLIRA